MKIKQKIFMKEIFTVNSNFEVKNTFSWGEG